MFRFNTKKVFYSHASSSYRRRSRKKCLSYVGCKETLQAWQKNEHKVEEIAAALMLDYLFWWPFTLSKKCSKKFKKQTLLQSLLLPVTYYAGWTTILRGKCLLTYINMLQPWPVYQQQQIGHWTSSLYTLSGGKEKLLTGRTYIKSSLSDAISVFHF